MSSNYLKVTYLFILVSFFNFPTTKALSLSFVCQYRNCSSNKTTTNSAFQLNVKTLFSSLSSKATASKFYNNTVPGRIPSDAVYGLFMCRGDVASQLCRQCVVNATQTLSSDFACYLSKQAVIWYDKCMVRYSNISFFSTVDISPTVCFDCFRSPAFVSNPSSFMRLLADTLNDTRDEAAKSSDGYATKQVNVSETQNLYSLAQCTRDLSTPDCSRCLDKAIAEIRAGYDGKQGGRVLSPRCNIRYQLYPFYRVPGVAAGGLLPETKYPQNDSEYSEDLGYLSHNCSSTTTDGDFQLNLTTLLSYLSSNSSEGQKFFETDISGTLYGLYLCRNDIPPHLCQQCVQNATHKITSECRTSGEAIIWYNHCMLRYSNQPLFDRMDTSPRFVMLNITNISYVNREYTFILSSAFAKMVWQTVDSPEKYQAESLKLNDNQTVYILAQCTPDLSVHKYGGCLTDAMGSAIPWSRLGSVGGRVLYPSCNLRFEVFQFYNLRLEAPKAAPPSSTGFYIWI